MLDHRLLREDTEECQRKLSRRDPEIKLSEFLDLDQKRRDLLLEEEQLKKQRNEASQAIAKSKRAGENAEEAIAQMQKVAGRIKELGEERKEVQEAWQEYLINLPNLPHDKVPEGQDEGDNLEVDRWGPIPEFSFTPLPHWELGANLDIIDIPRGTKVAGSRFYFMKKEGARLERALINFFLDYHLEHHGYEEVFPPFMANSDSLFAVGQLPKFAGDVFRCQGKDLYMIPTAEVPLTNLFREEILEDVDLPIKICAYSSCFRSEAGAHGRDTRGIIRQHQFNKVELVNFSAPEDSYAQLEILTSEAEAMLKKLGLPYRKVILCTGDLGFSSAFTYDLEVWIPGQNAYREISSCSNFVDFQARRGNIRYRPEKGEKARYLHTLNGSGLAVGRTVIAIMENFQDERGRVHIPEALQSYMGGTEIIE